MKRALFITILLGISLCVTAGEVEAQTVNAGKPLVCGSLGDITSDGVISQADITLARKFILGSATPTNVQKKAGDVNGSNSLTTLDITFINRYLLGLSTTFPACAIEQGSYTVAVDSGSAYNYRVVKAGTQNVPLVAFVFRAGSVEDIELKRVAFKLGSAGMNSPNDLVNRRLTIWDGATQVGEASFGFGDNATSSLLTTVRIPRGTSKTLTVKGDLITHDASTNFDSNPNNGGYGSLLVIGYDGNNIGINGNYAVGVSSGANISGAPLSVFGNGVRIFKNVPIVRITNLGANTLATGNPVYKFTVTNPDATSDLMLYKVSFGVSTSGPFAFNVKSFELRGAGVLAATAIHATDVNPVDGVVDTVEVVFNAGEARRVPAGGSKEYVLSATVSGMGVGTNSLNVKLRNDTVYPSLAKLMGKAGTAGVNVATAPSANNFIWSPFSTTSPTTAATAEANQDWTNSYGIPMYDKNGFLLVPTNTLLTQASEKTI